MSTAGSKNNADTKIRFAERHFLGRLSEELSELIAMQCAEAFDEEGLVIPVKSCSLMIAVEAREPASAKQLADALDRSHQLVSQKLPKLLKLDLLECEQDPQDSRQKLYRLTEFGREQIALFHALQTRLELAYERLHKEAGDVTGLLRSTLAALRDKPISERLK